MDNLIELLTQMMSSQNKSPASQYYPSEAYQPTKNPLMSILLSMLGGNGDLSSLGKILEGKGLSEILKTKKGASEEKEIPHDDLIL